MTIRSEIEEIVRYCLNDDEDLIDKIEQWHLSKIPKKKEYKGSSETGRAIHDLEWGKYNQCVEEITNGNRNSNK